MLNIYSLSAIIAIAAAIITAINFAIKKPENALVCYIKNFVGSLFIFSGFVKVVDPVGTAYKMNDYFAEFNLGFLANISVQISVFTVVLEVLLGIMLLLGIWRRLTTFALLGLILFFTLLTGYTSITGNVTDCGCFGDFLKLKPIVSFGKDIVLTIMIVFLFLNYHKITEYLKGIKGTAVVGLSTVLLSIFALSNYVWDRPVIDFRPFQVGVNIPEAIAVETEKVQSEPIFFVYENTETGETAEMTADELGKYPERMKAPWKYKDRRQKEVETSKVMDYIIRAVKTPGAEPENITDELLADQNYSFMVVNYSLKKTSKKGWEKTNKLYEKANAAGYNFYAVTKDEDAGIIDDFRHKYQTAYPFYTSDEKLLKTIIRSDPGIVLFKGGTIVNKWHNKKLPEFEKIKSKFMR